MPAVDNPASFDATLPGRIKALEDRLNQLSSVPLGKVKFATSSAEVKGFTYQGSTNPPVSVSTPITVPPFASRVALFVSASAVVCSNASAGTAAFSELGITVPELDYDSGNGANVFVQSNQQQQRALSATVLGDVNPGDVLNPQANGWATNTGANTDNFLSVSAFALFQY